MIVKWLLLTMPWVGLQCVIVVFPDHTHLFFVVVVFFVVFFQVFNSFLTFNDKKQ